MSHRIERGAQERGSRASALWGTGSRGGDSRSSVLWGKGGRGLVATCILMCALVTPLAATATPRGAAAGGSTFVAKSLLATAKSSPNEKVAVIIQATGGASDAESALRGVGGGELKKQLGLVGAVSATLPAKLVEKLQGVPGLTVTPDAPVKLADLTSPVKSTQLWPYVAGSSVVWPYNYAFPTYLKLPAIAIVDSGVQPRTDFGNRLVASVNLSTLAGNTSLTDDRGHGTFVAGIAAGAAPDLAGTAPTAPIVSIKVMDANGSAKTSDVISACQWILDHKATYNIKVANFSLHSSYSTNFYRDPLDRAVEKLWFGGVTVVAAAGNYGTGTGPSGVKYSPGNDPFVITVGGADLSGTVATGDDTVAPWSAYGYTNDGFYKPEIVAPGRYVVGPIPATSTIAAQRPDKLVGTDRIQLSGTSFAAPVVAGAAAQILALHPTWGPDQIKGVLMKTARKVAPAAAAAAGLGEVTIPRAMIADSAPNPNLGLDAFVKPDATGTGNVFDDLSWSSAAKASMSWNALSWASQSWSDLSWSDQSWSTLSWSDQSWSDLSWSDQSWSDLSWSDSAQEDAVEGDTTDATSAFTLDPVDESVASTDPDLNVPILATTP